MLRSTAHLAMLLALALGAAAAPIIVVGPEQKQFDRNLSDGGLPPVPGVANIQVFRACRPAPELSDGLGWTYHHHVDMACWNGRLYIAWNSCQKDEDVEPSRQLYSTSLDGFHWSKPAELFPQGAAAALRMYFFHASNGKMLTIAAAPAPAKNALVVREICADHSLAPVYQLQGPARNFEQSKDEGFVQACRQLLSNSTFLEQSDYGNLLGPRRMRWHDLNTWPPDEPSRAEFSRFGKAMCFYHRADGALVAIMKWGWAMLSRDEGQTWSAPVRPPTLVVGMAKIWGQRTADGRYALLYNPDLGQRFPLVMVSGADGVTFDTMRVVHGELPPMRYPGLYKMAGPQYVRGISEWSGDDSCRDPALWVCYSMSKEDIWVSRIPLPQPPAQANENWNIYSPVWAPVSIDSNVVNMEDRDPFDYARATRLFPETRAVNIAFEVHIDQVGRDPLLVELLAKGGPVRCMSLPADASEQWIPVQMQIQCPKQIVIAVGRDTHSIPIKATTVHGITFRTGQRLVPPAPELDRPVASLKCRIRNLVIQSPAPDPR